MTKIDCNKCINAIGNTITRSGPGKDNVEYVKTIECRLGYEIYPGGFAGPRCNGKFFEKK